ncbi:MAG: hypothetical protein KF824_10450 [Fimbriimonadaceae bacterium]|nr:MAG: hypothetical protein KF824_10450 [Fimbriimonadaceae bacterium]
MPEQVPIDRAIKNLEKRAESGDWKTKLTLARIHSYAYASQSKTVGLFGEELPDYDSVQPYLQKSPTATSLMHLRKSLAYYSEVTLSKSNEGLAWLGSGYVLEQASRWTAQNGTLKFGTQKLTTQKDFQTAALNAYRKCFNIGLNSDFKFKDYVMEGIESQWLCKESGEAIVRVVEKEKFGKYVTGEKAKIQAAIKRSNSRSSAITPILFPVHQPLPLNSLINQSARAKFDLVGDQQKRSWPWITNQAAWLVWDPKLTGKVTSGRQLFGNSTWWMFFDHGFSALSALDDNGDYWLQGRELTGISVWHDRNSNAVSDPGEVVPANLWGIQAIRTTYDYKSREALTSKIGIIMRDGQTLPTYDWIPVSHTHNLLADFFKQNL